MDNSIESNGNVYAVEPPVLGSPFHVECDESIFEHSVKKESKTYNEKIAPLRINKSLELVYEDYIQPQPSTTLLPSAKLPQFIDDGATDNSYELCSKQYDPKNYFNRHPRAPPPIPIESLDECSDKEDQISPREPHTPRSPTSWGSAEKPVSINRSLNVLSLNSPPSLSYSLRSSELDQAQIIQRMKRKHNCIREMYNTEWQFAQDMAVVVRIYICASASVGFSVREIDTLFTNIPQVMDISLCTVAILEANIPEQILRGEGSLNDHDILADRDIKIGKAMCIALTGQLYEVYESYIHRNKDQMVLVESLMTQMKHTLNMGTPRSVTSTPAKESAISQEGSQPKLSSVHNLRFSLESGVTNQLFGSKPVSKRTHQQKSEKHVTGRSKADMHKMKQWLDRCKERASKFTTAWALDCLLIKPIQRLGKYPLFLKNILDCSSPDEQGYEDLLRAYKRSMHYLDCVNTRYGETE